MPCVRLYWHAQSAGVDEAFWQMLILSVAKRSSADDNLYVLRDRQKSVQKQGGLAGWEAGAIATGGLGIRVPRMVVAGDAISG